MRCLLLFLLFVPMVSWAQFLEVSTAQDVELGPFVDATDGVSEEIGLGLADDIEISKNGLPFEKISSASITEDASGYYRLGLTSSHTDTLGILLIYSASSGVHVPVFQRYQVVPSNVYDSFVNGTDYLQTDVTQVSGSAEDIATETNVDANETKIDTLTTNVGTVDTTVGNIQTDLDNATDGLGALKTLIDAAQSTLDGLNDLSAADVAGELATYDGPTKAELDSGLAGLNDLSAAQLASATAALETLINALNDISTAQVNAEVDTALADYDGPTKAELDSGLAGLNDLSAAQVNAEADTAISDAFTFTGGDVHATLDGETVSASVSGSSVWGATISNNSETATAGEMLERIHAWGAGKSLKSGDVYSYYYPGGSTLIYSATHESATRTVTEP